MTKNASEDYRTHFAGSCCPSRRATAHGVFGARSTSRQLPLAVGICGLLLQPLLTSCKTTNTASSGKALTTFSHGDQVDLTTYAATTADYTASRQEIERDQTLPGMATYADLTTAAQGLSAYTDPNQPYHTLDIAEVVALKAYTGNAYRPMNTALRAGDWRLLQAYTGLIKTAASGINKMPATSGVLTRGATFIAPDGALSHGDDYQVGRVVVETAFTSTTTGDSDQGGFCGNTKFVISSQSGHGISWLSDFPQEAEVLFSPGTEFKVLSRVSEAGPANTTCATQRTLVTLQEVPSGTAAPLVDLSSAGSATTNCAQPSGLPAVMIDGDVGSVWTCSLDGNQITSDGQPLTISLNLGQAVQIERLHLILPNGNTPPAVTILAAGSDGTFTTVKEQPPSSDNPESIYFDSPVSAQQLRFVFASPQPSAGGEGFAVAEIEVFGQ